MKSGILRIASNVFLGLLILTITYCGDKRNKEPIEDTKISDIEIGIKYQQGELEKSNQGLNKLMKLNELIKEYKAFEKSSSQMPNYNFLIGRLYLVGAKDLFYEFLYDSTRKAFLNKLLYETYVDSTIYYNKRALELDKNHIWAMSNLCSVFIHDITNKSRFDNNEFLFTRNPSAFNEVTNFIVNHYQAFISFNGSEFKPLAQNIVETAFFLLTVQISDDKSKGVDISNSNTTVRLKNIEYAITFLDNYQSGFTILKPKQYSEIKSFYWPYITQAKILEAKKNEEAYQESMAEVYQNTSCDKLWIYPNGRYKQEFYRIDLESLPYDEMMRIDVRNCDNPNVKLYVDRRSEGAYKVVGEYYYFYPDPKSDNIIAGFDRNKNLPYLRKDERGGFVWINPATFEDMSYRKIQ